MSYHSSERASAIAFTGGSAQALIGLKVAGARREDETEPEQPSMAAPLSRATLVAILAVYMYMDSSVALWNQMYKDTRLAREDDGCATIRQMFCEDYFNRSIASASDPEAWLEENEPCSEFDPRTDRSADGGAEGIAQWWPDRRLQDVQLLLDEPSDGEAPVPAPAAPVATAAPVVTAAPAPDDTRLPPDHQDDTVAPEGFNSHTETFQDRGCSWKIERSHHLSAEGPEDDRRVVIGPFRRRAQTYTKGAALGVQASCGLMLFWAYNYWAGGKEQFMLCFDVPRLLRFGIVGCAFGLSAVFSFFAQDALPPGSYALYAQSGIIVVPVLWRIVFNTPLNYMTWVHIVLIGVGIVMYRVSEMGSGENSNDLVGLFWVGAKVITTSLATVFAELFLKDDRDKAVPFSVQCSYILPWKILTTFSTIVVLPPHRLPDRPGGLFHDWNIFTVIIISHNLGDTIGSAIVAKLFDSVVKAVTGVLSIIFPTWTVAYLAGWETIAFETAEGQLKASGALIVVLGSLAYTLGRNMTGQMDAAQKLLDKYEEDEQAGSSYRSPTPAKGGRQGIEMPDRGIARQDSTGIFPVVEEESKQV